MICYQAIQTRYLGPTNANSARVSAKASAGRVVVPWDHSANVDDNHLAAARALTEKLGWVGPHYGDLAGGVMPCGDYVFVMMEAAAQ